MLPTIERPAAPARTHDEETGPGAPRLAQPSASSSCRSCNGVLTSNQVLLNVVVPLWLVERTDAPHTLLAWLFGTNTVMAVLLQVRASRGSETVPGALRAVRLCGLVVRAVVPGHQRHPRDRRLGLDRPDLAGSRDDHRCGAVAVGLRLGLPVRAVRPSPARRLPGRLGPGLPGAADHLPRPLHVPRAAVGRARLGRDRGASAVLAAVVAHPAARAAERFLAACRRVVRGEPAHASPARRPAPPERACSRRGSRATGC